MGTIPGRTKPSQGGQRPGGTYPFPEDAILRISVDDSDKLVDEKVILHLPDLTAVTKTYQDFHDTGSPKEQAENIWAFRARSLAFSMAICAALAADMNQTVTSLGRAEWHNRIGPLAQQISDAQAAAQILCNRVAETKNPRPAQQPLPAHETE